MIITTVVFYHDRKQVKSARKRLFESSLLMTAVSIGLNIAGVYGIENYRQVPHWINAWVNCGYFLVSVWACSMIAAYLFDLLLEHVYVKTCRTRAVVGLSLVNGIYTLLTLSNAWTGLMFWFDAEGAYHRGPLNRLGYGVMLIELLMVMMCYLRNRESVGQKVRKVIYTLPPVVLLLALFQIAYPEILLNGTILTFALLIIFVNFQHSQVEKDSLTGVGNRKDFYEELFLRLKGKQRFQIAMVSLLDFAAVNQKFGYRRGDEFLYHIARWLDEFQKDGRAFRFSNVTFALICPYVDAENSRSLLEAMESRFGQPWSLGETVCKIPACFGAMICEESELEATQVVELLSFMVESAKTKEDGKVLFDREAERMFWKKKHLEQVLQEAAEKRNFEVWYQPIFNCALQRFDSAEALIRLRDPEGKLVSPAEFIPLAEENGLIDEIGWFVWKEACRFVGGHSELSLHTVSVNMSAQQFLNPELRSRMEAVLEENGLSADRIKLEITERVILSDEKYMKQLMRDFSANGFRFCVDDFGIGYSNFSGVMHLPFECIKLDQSLIEKIPSDAQDRLVVRSMIELFHSMGMRVVAEGVETKVQKELIEQMGADYIQGYYFAKPMPEAEVLAFLSKT
ncbi:MAG: bifunctional diguanylate cyclase/phosphodiesterase [Lachnospiraceae bacterium]|nr:bifunctional diguanylate cyclase/phosphodiesterase [Lachnospiraceae bacterium]